MKNVVMRSHTLSNVCTGTALLALCVGTFGCFSSNERSSRRTDTGPSSEQGTAQRTTTNGPGREIVTAQQFAQKTALGGQKEVQLSQVAAQRAENAEVKSFAQRMVQDHSE